jgi:hypothetical protein
MIPEIGLMIAGYIFARLVELTCKPGDQFTSSGAQAVVTIFAILSMVATLFISLHLVVRSGST